MEHNIGMPSTSTPKAAKEKLQPDPSPKQSPVNRPKQPHLPVGAKDPGLWPGSAKGPGPGPGSASTPKSKASEKASDKQDNKRRREDIPSSGEGSAVGGSLMDASEITVKHDTLKQLLDGAVQDAIKAVMSVVSTRLEASLRNIYETI